MPTKYAIKPNTLAAIIIGTIAKPSKPSVKFTALDEPTTTKLEKKHHTNIPKSIVKSFMNGKAIIPCRSSSETR